MEAAVREAGGELADLRGRQVVIYFYPKDDTSGCTAEACAFRDASPRLEAAGAVVLVAACDSQDPATEYDGPPRRGGTLRVGALGKPSGLTTDPYALIANDSDMFLLSLIYDPLTVPNTAKDSRIGAVTQAVVCLTP